MAKGYGLKVKGYGLMVKGRGYGRVSSRTEVRDPSQSSG